MKVRIKFQKYGAMKFIGHLDVMRYFQKAFRRAGFDNEYSKGFSPHQIMSFAAPLGVGLTSDGEYLDVELKSSDSPEIMVKRLNEVMTEGFRIIGYKFLKEREENQKNVTAMAQVAFADYLVSVKDGYAVPELINTQENFSQAFREFYAADGIVVDKKTKTSEKAVDIKPMITLAAFTTEEYEEQKEKTLLQLSQTTDSDGASGMPISVADVYRNGMRVYLQLATGSSANLKPELVMEAFFHHIGAEFQGFAWQVHRLEVYSRDEQGDKLIPLDGLDR